MGLKEKTIGFSIKPFSAMLPQPTLPAHRIGANLDSRLHFISRAPLNRPNENSLN